MNDHIKSQGNPVGKINCRHFIGEKGASESFKHTVEAAPGEVPSVCGNPGLRTQSLRPHSSPGAGSAPAAAPPGSVGLHLQTLLGCVGSQSTSLKYSVKFHLLNEIFTANIQVHLPEKKSNAP